MLGSSAAQVSCKAAPRSWLIAVSHGHGLSDLRGDKLSHLLIFEYLDKLFPAREGSSIGSYEPGKNSFINGAVPAMGECSDRGAA